MKSLKHIILIQCLLYISVNEAIIAQNVDTIKKEFSVVCNLKTTPVKNQSKSNTCWSYSTLAMLETEILKDDKTEFELSEMFIIYYTYIEKAEKYLRFHGNIQLVSGGSLIDPMRIIKNYGIVPREEYTGLVNGAKQNDHTALDAELKSYLEPISKNRKLSPTWKEGYIKILDKYLGTPPESFKYKGKIYSPLTFAAFLGINENDYLFFSSFCNKPYYSNQIVEVPDNWSFESAINLPLNDYKAVIDNALKKGYPVAVAADVSERGFQWRKGIAQTGNDPDNNLEIDEPSLEPNRDDTSFTKSPELAINPLMRQRAFDTYETTDDHGMLITGIARDENKNKYYIVKNSWGSNNNQYKGFIYISESYLLYKTLTILVHKKGVPIDILNKIERGEN